MILYYHSTQIAYVPHLLPLSFSLATILLGEKLGAMGGKLPPWPPMDRTCMPIDTYMCVEKQ